MLLLSSEILLQASQKTLEKSELTTRLRALEAECKLFAKKAEMQPSYDDSAIKTQVEQIDAKLKTCATIEALRALEQQINGLPKPDPYNDSDVKTQLAELNAIIKQLTEIVPGDEGHRETTQRVLKRFVDVATFQQFQAELDNRFASLPAPTTPYNVAILNDLTARITRLEETLATHHQSLTSTAKTQNKTLTTAAGYRTCRKVLLLCTAVTAATAVVAWNTESGNKAIKGAFNTLTGRFRLSKKPTITLHLPDGVVPASLNPPAAISITPVTTPGDSSIISDLSVVLPSIPKTE